MKASKPRKSSTEEDFEPPQVVIQAKPIMPTLIKPKKSSPEREFAFNIFFYMNCSNLMLQCHTAGRMVTPLSRHHLHMVWSCKPEIFSFAES